MCVNKMRQRKDISNDLKEAIAAAYKSLKAYNATSKKNWSKKDFWTDKNSGDVWS